MELGEKKNSIESQQQESNHRFHLVCEGIITNAKYRPVYPIFYGNVYIYLRKCKMSNTKFPFFSVDFRFHFLSVIVNCVRLPADVTHERVQINNVHTAYI